LRQCRLYIKKSSGLENWTRQQFIQDNARTSFLIHFVMKDKRLAPTVPLTFEPMVGSSRNLPLYFLNFLSTVIPTQNLYELLTVRWTRYQRHLYVQIQTIQSLYLAYFPCLNKKENGFMRSFWCVCVLLNSWISSLIFDEIWCGCYGAGGLPNRALSDFLQSVIIT
jgi:hypothetical protein